MAEIASDDARNTIAQMAAVLAPKSAHQLLLLLGLLACLLGVCGVGCGIGTPPALTLDQWEAQYRRTRSTGE
jgi:hypothetical protein